MVVPFPWRPLAFDLLGALLSACLSLATQEPRGAVAALVMAALFLGLALLQVAAWCWYEHRHQRLADQKRRAHREWERAKADLEARARDLALTLGRDVAACFDRRAR